MNLEKKIETFIRRHFPYKEIGWKEYQEDFTRYILFKSKFFSIYLHQLNAPVWQPKCHDHPWWFIAFLIWPGYYEKVGEKIYHRWPGSILYRPASFTHDVLTVGTSWSIILAGPKSREWGFKPCVFSTNGQIGKQ